MAKFFGFEFRRADQDVAEPDQLPSVVPPTNSDGASVVLAGGTQSFMMDLDGAVRTESELIARYRELALHPEVESAIDDVVNEAIVTDQDTPPVTLDVSDLDIPDNLKNIIHEEFDHIVRLLEFNTKAYEVFKTWYVDGRLYYNVIIDEAAPEEGIIGLRNVNAMFLRKVREVISEPDQDGFNTIQTASEYYLYQEGGFRNTAQTASNFSIQANQLQTIRIAKDSIVYVTSGLQDHGSYMVLSYLHSAIKPFNQLRMLEDAAIIYRLVRAPERRVFKIDVGGMPRPKAEQYIREMMLKHKNKVVYDQMTGEVRDERKFMTMMEDYWFPSQNGKGTDVDVLQGGQNLGEMTDVEYFKNNLYEALKVPKTRLNPEGGFNLGRPTEITRDELKFMKFVSRLRLQFSQLFLKLLKTQLILRRIVSADEWTQIEPFIKVKYTEDNYFEELKNSEILRDRLQTLTMIDPYIGVYYSRSWVNTNVLHLSEDEVKQIAQENAEDIEYLQMRAEMGESIEVNPKMQLNGI